MIETQFLYLTTTGRKSGKPHQIEIWFVEHGGSFYLVSEAGENADWVRNLINNPAVIVSIGRRDAALVEATARPIDRTQETELTQTVAALMNAKYEWSDGLIVELKPNIEHQDV